MSACVACKGIAFIEGLRMETTAKHDRDDHHDHRNIRTALVNTKQEEEYVT